MKCLNNKNDEYSQINEHINTCTETKSACNRTYITCAHKPVSKHGRFHSQSFFVCMCLYALEFQTQSKMPWQRVYEALQWNASYRYTLEQIVDIHSPNHKLPVELISLIFQFLRYLYSFLWRIFFYLWCVPSLNTIWLSEWMYCTMHRARLCGIKFLMKSTRIANSIH